MSRRPLLLLLLLVAVELLACLGDLLLGPFGRVHWEEAFNARAGVQIACGHLEDAFRLQYVPFCGGCTGEALLAAPLFVALGPTVLVWKLVPLGFHAVVLVCGGLLALRAAGPRAAALFVLMLAAAPGYYRELVLTGWGNHAESAAFPLLAALLLTGARGRRRLPLLLLAGLVTGLGLWFCHTMAWSLAPLLLAAIVVSRFGWPLFLAGLAGGFLPWRLYFADRPEESERTLSWALGLHPAPPAAWLDWLFGPYLRWGLWDPADHGEGSWMHGGWWFLLWAVALPGLVLLVLRLRDADAGTRVARLLAPVGLLALLAAYAVRYDLWSHLPEVPSQPTLGLRYRAPLVPLLSFGVAALLGAGLRSRLATAGAAILALLLVGFGLGRRVLLWTDLHRELPGLLVYDHSGWRDRSVPLGEPPQRLPRAQGRPQDIDAAVDFLAGHQDRWPACRLDHVFETGRRLGIAAERGGVAAVRPLLPPVLGEVQDEGAVRMLADGMATAMLGREGEGLVELEAVADALAQTEATALLGAELPAAAGRRLAEERAPETLHELAPRVRDGLCEAWGMRHAQAVAQALRVDAEAPRLPAERAAEADACGAHAAFWLGVGRGRARHVGCHDAAARALRDAAGLHADAAMQGFDAGCLQYRDSLR